MRLIFAGYRQHAEWRSGLSGGRAGKVAGTVFVPVPGYPCTAVFLCGNRFCNDAGRNGCKQGGTLSEMVGLWDKISGFPNGIYEKFNKLLNDDGKELSGGEKQKLLLARSLYRSAPIIILDEPTSALDPLAEEELYQSYNELLGGRTMIFVSHRLSSTRFCDRILFLESGQIAEQGTFEELREQKGKYAEMFHSQAKYYAGSTYGEAEEHE